MKHPKLIALLLLLLTAHRGRTQWTQTDGPYGTMPVRSLTGNDSVLIAVTPNGCFVKKKLGERWRLLDGTAPGPVALKGDTLYAGTLHVNALRRIGLQPTAMATEQKTVFYLTSLAASNGRLYAGTSYHGLLYSDDNGRSWTARSEGLPPDTLSFPDAPNPAYKYIGAVSVVGGYVYCSGSNGLFRADTVLFRWNRVGGGLRADYAGTVQQFGDSLYTTQNRTLYVSDLHAAQWRVADTFPSYITSVAQQGNTFYISTSDSGVYCTRDRFASVRTLNAGLSDRGIRSLRPFGSTVVCGSYASGTYYLENGTWIPDRDGMICSQLRRLRTAKGALIATGDEVLFRSDDRNRWHPVAAPPPPDDSLKHVQLGDLGTAGDTLLLSAEYRNNRFRRREQLSYSTDLGGSWKTLQDSVPGLGSRLSRFAYDRGRIYAYIDDYLQYTDDLGATWTGSRLPAEFYDLECAVVKNGVILGAEYYGTVIQLGANGWTYLGRPAPISTLLYTGSTLLGFSDSSVYRSPDNGFTWTLASGRFRGGRVTDYLTCRAGLVVAGDSGVFVSPDLGETWRSVNDGLKDLRVTGLAVQNDTLYAATCGNGVWKRAVAQLYTKVDAQAVAERAVRLYPNPASDRLTIRAGEPVLRVRLIDPSGREILSAVPDDHGSVSLATVPPGLYFAQVRTGCGNGSAPLLIVK